VLILIMDSSAHKYRAPFAERWQEAVFGADFLLAAGRDSGDPYHGEILLTFFSCIMRFSGGFIKEKE
jgi:hypothetical protein